MATKISEDEWRAEEERQARRVEGLIKSGRMKASLPVPPAKSATDPNTMRELLTEKRVEALSEFRVPCTVIDTKVPGLRLRVGKFKTSWVFKQQHRFRGARSTSYEVLGHWPGMSLEKARDAALQEAAKNAKKKPRKNKSEALCLDDAIDDYVKYLEEKATRDKKDPLWSRMVAKTAHMHLSPTFGRWKLAELASGARNVRELHEKIEKNSGPSAADHAIKILRAVYTHAAKEEEELPPQLPTRSVRFHKYVPSSKGIPLDGFGEWRRRLDLITMPVRRSFHLTNLLTGCRPGELARLARVDIDLAKGEFIIPRGKTGDIRVILSERIIQALDIALNAHYQDLIFPGCRNDNPIDKLLPVKGHALRRTYRTVAAEIEINPVLTSILMSHSLVGINAKYINEAMLTAGNSLRQAQHDISEKIAQLLGLG